MLGHSIKIKMQKFQSSVKIQRQQARRRGRASPCSS